MPGERIGRMLRKERKKEGREDKIILLFGQEELEREAKTKKI